MNGGSYLCPAPALPGSAFAPPCLALLPCAEHEVPNPTIGHLLYGNVYLSVNQSPWNVPHVERGRTVPRAPRRRRRLLLVALAVLSAVLVVSCMGDDAFTGKALLTLAVVSATSLVLLIDLARPNRNGATS